MFFDVSVTKARFVLQRDGLQTISQYCDLEIILNAASVWYKIMMHCHLEPTLLSERALILFSLLNRGILLSFCSQIVGSD